MRCLRPGRRRGRAGGTDLDASDGDVDVGRRLGHSRGRHSGRRRMPLRLLRRRSACGDCGDRSRASRLAALERPPPAGPRDGIDLPLVDHGDALANRSHDHRAGLIRDTFPRPLRRSGGRRRTRISIGISLRCRRRPRGHLDRSIRGSSGGRRRHVQRGARASRGEPRARPAGLAVACGPWRATDEDGVALPLAPQTAVTRRVAARVAAACACWSRVTRPAARGGAVPAEGASRVTWFAHGLVRRTGSGLEDRSQPGLHRLRRGDRVRGKPEKKVAHASTAAM